MAWHLNGTDQYARFTMSAALQAATGGPFTFGAVVNLDSATDGALIHFLDGTAGRHFLEIFTTYNFGTAAAAKSGPAGVGGGTTWVYIIMSKPTGNVPVEYTIFDLTGGGAPTSGTATGGNLGNGAAPGAAGQIQVGRFALSATEYVAGKVAALWGHASYMNQATREGLTTWALTVSAASAGGNGWAVRLDTLSTITDATGAGGNETGRFGTTPFTLASDPSGPFFGGGVTIQDTSGGGGTAGTPDELARGDSSGGSATSGSDDGRTLGDSSGGSGTGGQLDGRTLGDVSGGAGTAGSPDGLARGDISGGSGTGGSVDGRSLGDVSGGAGTGGSPDTVDAGAPPVVIQDTSGGSGTGGSADGRTLGDSSGGAGTGGSPDGITTPGVPVTISDTSGGAGTGGSPDTAATSQVVHDKMVMPIVLNAHACLVVEVGKVASPPKHVQIRPGATFTAMADQVGDECCDGIAWVRPGTQTPTTGHWPDPIDNVDGVDGGQPVYWAIQLELGIERCIPTVSNVEGEQGRAPTGAQWLQATQDHLDDAAALRRAACCLMTTYGNDGVLIGPVTPLQNEGNCGGQTVVVTVRAPACDCIDAG